jgi:flagellar hook-associated protein 3 FlgL
MRVSDLSSQQQISQFTLQTRERYAAQQARIASGNYQTRRSEDSRQAGAAARSATTLDELKRRQQLLDTATYTETQTAASLDGILDAVQRLRELVVSARDATKNPADRQALAKEVDSLLEDLAAAGNRQVDGQYLFGGEAGQAPLQVTRVDGRITAVVTTATSPRSFLPGDGSRLPVGAIAAGEGGIFANADTGYDLLGGAIALRDRLAAGEVATDDDIAGLDVGLQEVTGGLVMSGINQRRLESVSSQASTLEQGERTRLDGLTSLDMSTAVIELNRLQVTYQASLQMAANVQRLSMVQFV